VTVLSRSPPRFLLLYLRELADVAGDLTEEFDGFVRDSFLEPVAAG
jgi:hypothetical protein